jgi:hypothetical protein
MDALAAAPVEDDAARRIADEMTLHALAGKAGHWCAFRLADGTPMHRGTCYETRREAVRFCKWDRDRVIYLEVQPVAMDPREAQACLNFARQLHDAGFRIPDPDFEYSPTMPLLPADRVKTIRHLASGGRRH